MRWHIAVLIVVAAAGLTAIFVQFFGIDEGHWASAPTLDPITAREVQHNWTFVPPSR